MNVVRGALSLAVEPVKSVHRVVHVPVEQVPVDVEREATGALDAAHDLGLDIPGDVSIAGFDAQPEAAWVRPRLTAVQQAIEPQGRVAADFLTSVIRGETRHPHQVLQATPP